MIKVYKIDGLKYTPFDADFNREDFNYLLSNGVEFTENKEKADLYVGSNAKLIKRFLLKNPLNKKKILLWTNEPRFSNRTTSSYRPYYLLPRIEVMNVFTGDVLLNNVPHQKRRFFGKKKLAYISNDFYLTDKRIVALMSYYYGGKFSAYYIEGKNIDLIKLRTEIALKGHSQELMTIFGAGWPEGISKEDSRKGNWVYRKREILKDYNFNLCFENTVCPFYITEKIWDSIENYCLPIYYGGGNSSIYDLFPEDSFLDYSKFECPDSLFKFIQLMGDSEFIRRMNKCITVYNGFIDKPADFWEGNKKLVLNSIIERIIQLKSQNKQPSSDLQ